MDILKVIKDGETKYATSFQVKGKQVEYFVRGEGWHKTKKHEIVSVEPMYGNHLNYAIFARQFGDDVAVDLTSISIYSHSFIVRANALFAALEALSFPEIPGEFIALLKFDSKLACMGYACLDIFALDDHLRTPDGVSLKEQVEQLYGSHAVKLIEYLIGGKNGH